MTSQAPTALACLAASHSVRTMVHTCVQHDQIEFIFFPSHFRYIYAILRQILGVGWGMEPEQRGLS